MVEDRDVKLFQKAFSLFTCADVRTGYSIRAQQVHFFSLIDLDENKSVIQLVFQQFLRICPAAVHTNTYNGENVIDEYPAGKSYYLGRGPQGGLEIEIDPRFIRNIESWFYSLDYPRTAMFSVTVNLRRGSSALTSPPGGHAVVILFTKLAPPFTGLQCVYLDSESSKYTFQDAGLFTRQIENHLGVNVQNMTPKFLCPLQTSEQGGNCVQWSLLYMLCIICHPEYISDPDALHAQLLEEVNVNMMVFELYLFYLTNRFLPDYKGTMARESKGAVVRSRLLDKQSSTEILVHSSPGVQPCARYRGFKNFEYMFQRLEHFFYKFRDRGFFVFAV